MHASMSSHGDDVLQYFSPKEGEVVIDVGEALDELRYKSRRPLSHILGYIVASEYLSMA